MDPGGTWKLVDQRAELRKQGRLTQAEGRRLTRRIPKAINDDRKEQARQAGHAIMAALKGGDLRKAYGTLRAWHKECDPAASKPCYGMLEDQTRERVKLYRKRAPPGDRIPSSLRSRTHHPQTRSFNRQPRSLAVGLREGLLKCGQRT